MLICKCCQPLQDVLGELDEAYDCTSSTPTVNGKRFAIQSRTRRFCRIDMDQLMPGDAQKCDFAFATCSESSMATLQDEQGDHREKYEPWYFVELAGDSKSSEDCYEQLKASILYFRGTGALRAAHQKPHVEGYVIGSKPTTSRRKSKASNTIKILKDRFVEKDKLGRKLEFPQEKRHVLTLDD